MVDSERENGSSPTPPPQKAEVKNYGVMNPISYAGPSEADVHRNALLEKVDYSLAMGPWPIIFIFTF